MEDYPRMLLNMLSNLHQYHLRYSNQLHGSAMAINLSSTILKFSRFLVKKIYFAIYTTPCVNMSVSVCLDPSFREEIGFVILHHKFNENIWIGKFF